ncbi:MAG: ABC transporter ATP-binding protein [Alphaproteobacteria bacterium]|nr:ABC transporter ATP-binding protein [Alphaproteobacteria bacterium]
MTHPDALLEVSNLAYSYNGLAAVRDVSFHVGSGEVVALLGGNGAGKSTTVKVVAGAFKAKSGTIRFDGEAIEGQPSHVVVKRGITLVPEGRLVFPLMTVEENLQMGGFTQPAASVARAIEHSFTLFPRLAERRAQRAGSLSGGEQQMLAIARGLMSAPRLMILDEPSLGLAPIRVQELFRLIAAIAEEGVAIVLVEQNVHQSLKIAHRGYVIERGTTVLGGTGEELLGNDYVRRAFLGR